LLRIGGAVILDRSWAIRVAIRAPEFASACSRSNRDPPMPSETDTTSPAEPAGYRDIGILAEWSDGAVTAAAAGLALMIVMTVAILMGMA
jgi:hypothetical protein